MRWAVGVTTIPSRRRDLLPRTLASLDAAGFEDVRLFVDGCDDPRSWQSEFGLDVTCRQPAVFAFANWALGLAELWARAPEAERFAMFQDDVVCCQNLRPYLDRCRYPDGPANRIEQPGYWNLYEHRLNRHLAKGQGFQLSNQRGFGAMALVFSREAVLTLLSSRPHFVERPGDVKPDRWRKIDGAVVSALAKARPAWREYFHSPSLVAHIGKVSTINKLQGVGGPRPTEDAAFTWPESSRPLSFPGEEFDALGLLKGAGGGL